MKVGKPTFITTCLNWYGLSGFFCILSKMQETYEIPQ